MKQILFTIAALLTSMAAAAQTLNVNTGGAIYQFPADQTGVMTFSGGTQMTIMGKTFDPSTVGKMWTDDSTPEDNNVNIVYNGTEALVYVAGNIAQYVDATISGAHVTIAQTNTEDVDLAGSLRHFPSFKVGTLQNRKINDTLTQITLRLRRNQEKK